jgi:hemoglobin
MDAGETTVFERVGGATAIAAIVAALYERAQADPELAGYFHTTDMEAQRQRLAEMIGQALGGPEAPWLKGLEEAHRGRGVSHRHFSLMAAHLMDVLIEFDLDPDEADIVMNWVAQGREAVVEDPDY